MKHRIAAALLVAALSMGAQAHAQMPRGEYIAKMGDCVSCHTAPGHPEYAGGLALFSPVGKIYSTNITPDKQYGIGDYSLADFRRAIQKGIAKDGHHLYPAMPYPSFAKMTDADVAALYDYFMHEVQPVHAKPAETKLAFPFNQRWGMAFWNFAFLPDGPYKPRPDRDAQWNRGAYIAQSAGHCGACHTPRNLAFAERGDSEDSQYYLSGGMADRWYAPNLRGDMATGLKEWSEADIAQFLKTGHARGVAALGNMRQAVENSTQYLTDADRQALAHYLKSLSAAGERSRFAPASAMRATDAFERPGAGLYATACAGCHQANGQGREPRAPRLAGNPLVLAENPASVLAVILGGDRTADTQTGPRPARMPSFSRLTDAEVAAVATYIRQSWGNAAPAVTPREVRAERRRE
jgi:mono/diheme cytochrome c family protein